MSFGGSWPTSGRGAPSWGAASQQEIGVLLFRITLHPQDTTMKGERAAARRSEGRLLRLAGGHLSFSRRRTLEWLDLPKDRDARQRTET